MQVNQTAPLLFSFIIQLLALDIGNLHGKNMLWPVGFGESASSNMHARVRMKLANNMETILLDGASNTAKSIDDLSQVFRKGNEMISQIKNLSTFHSYA